MIPLLLKYAKASHPLFLNKENKLEWRGGSDCRKSKHKSVTRHVWYKEGDFEWYWERERQSENVFHFLELVVTMKVCGRLIKGLSQSRKLNDSGLSFYSGLSSSRWLTRLFSHDYFLLSLSAFRANRRSQECVKESQVIRTLIWMAITQHGLRSLNCCRRSHARNYSEVQRPSSPELEGLTMRRRTWLANLDDKTAKKGHDMSHDHHSNADVSMSNIKHGRQRQQTE